MSLKYQRVKQADLLLPAPLRWLTRAFSSITMAVILLVIIMLYGMFASVPIGFLATAGVKALVVAFGLLLPVLVVGRMLRRPGGTWGTVWATFGWLLAGNVLCAGAVATVVGIMSLFNRPLHDWGLNDTLTDLVTIAVVSATAVFAAVGVRSIVRRRQVALRLSNPGVPNTAAALAVIGWIGIYLGMHAAVEWMGSEPWFDRHRATVIYRLPYLEMTELEFYAWWPMVLVLTLFVLNMTWATIRRIEFKFVNIGVLTVHTGIVIMGLASIFYGSLKIEGDTIIFRDDLGGKPVDHFFDSTTPAIYFTLEGKEVMISLDDLPRYNDYDREKRELNIELHEYAAFKQVMGDRLRATIRGFISYGELAPAWKDLSTEHGLSEMGAIPDAMARPAIRVAIGGEDKADPHQSQLLIGHIPAERVLEQPTWAVEFLVAPGKERIDNLTAEFDGPHGLVVEVPGQDFRAVYAIAPGQTITVGDTGYTLKVEDIGPYGMAFVTRGYEGATDTRATIHVSNGDKTFRRMAMHRYPERSQDFVPDPGNPNVGPMGRRTDPDPAIRLSYIDATTPQYRIIVDTPGASEFRLVARLPGAAPIQGMIPRDRFPMFRSEGVSVFLHIVEHMKFASQVLEPTIVPRNQRLPKEEGTYIHALLPVDLEMDMPDGGKWQRTVWLAHMRYPNPQFAAGINRPQSVNVPGVGPAAITFSRVRIPLPFAIGLKQFEMQPYPGSDIPRDYVATLQIIEPSETGQPDETIAVARLNNPYVYRAHHGPVITRKVKLSQTGWDPGDRNDPQHKARDEQGRFTNQQRYTILGVGNNVGIRVIALGSILIAVGIPWAFYVKPLLVQRQKRRLQAELAKQKSATQPA